MAVAVDSEEASGNAHRGTSDGTALTWSFTNTAGDLLLLAVEVTGFGGSPSVTAGPTYGGQAMTLVPGSDVLFASNAARFAVYYLVNPPTGSNTVSVTGHHTGSSFAILAGAISFSGAAIAPGQVTTGSGTSGTTATAGDITADSGNYIFAGGGWGSGTGGSAGSGFTRTFLTNGSGATGGDDILGEYEASTGAAITPTFTFTGSDNWAIAAVEVRVTPSGPAGKILQENGTDHFLLEDGSGVYLLEGDATGTTVTPGTASLTLTAFAPTILAPRLVTPGTATLTTTRFTPTVLTPRLVTPGKATLTLTRFAPTVTTTQNMRVTPGTASLVTARFAPTVLAPRLVTPGTASLTTARFAPTVTVSAVGVTVTPGTASLITARFTPTVSTPRLVTPGKAALTLTTFAPSVTIAGNVYLVPGKASLVLWAFGPEVLLSGSVLYGKEMRAFADNVSRERWLAVNRLMYGWGGTTAADHAAGEFCITVIAYKATSEGNLLDDTSQSLTNADVIAALTEGRGLGIKDSDHLGGESCVDTIRRLT